MAEEAFKEEFKRKFIMIQQKLLELCMAVTDEKADKVYAYASMKKSGILFNAFFEIDRKTITLDELDIDDDLSSEFLRTGTYDLIDLIKLCEEYNIPNPTEIKLCYNVRMRNITLHYGYEPNEYTSPCSLKTDLDGSDVFMDWVNEVKNKTGT